MLPPFIQSNFQVQMGLRMKVDTLHVQIPKSSFFIPCKEGFTEVLRVKLCNAFRTTHGFSESLFWILVFLPCAGMCLCSFGAFKPNMGKSSPGKDSQGKEGRKWRLSLRKWFMFGLQTRDPSPALVRTKSPTVGVCSYVTMSLCKCICHLAWHLLCLCN